MNWPVGPKRTVRASLVALAAILACGMVLSASAVAAGSGQGEQAHPSTSAERRYAAEPMPLIELYSPGGPGRLYTTDLDEARRAASGGMRQEDAVVGYLPRGGVNGGKALHRLKEHPSATAWLLVSWEEERSGLVDDGWVDEGIVGYVYEESAPGRVELLRFFNGQEWRVADESYSDELLAAGYTLDGSLGYVYDTWIRAGAVYFPMWHEGGHTKEAKCEEHYGRWDVWCGVRDFYEGHPYSKTWPGNDFEYL
jgi:hypothetical protein